MNEHDLPSDHPEQAPNHSKYLDRDYSWLEFNRRVLHEAVDERTPLLERLMFLGIFTSNLDEFFMKRVGLAAPQFPAARAQANVRSQAESAAHDPRNAAPHARRPGELLFRRDSRRNWRNTESTC